MTENSGEWSRLPFEITNDQDRRTLCGILSAYGAEVRVARDKLSTKVYHRFVEYKRQEVAHDE